jgi:uncharacterized membrane protein (UPF0136 family)
MFQAVMAYLYVFGVRTIAGGVVGVVKAKGKASLIAGTVAGVLLLVSGYLVGVRGRDGLFLGLGVSASLAGRFVVAFVRSRKVMPAGVMAALSVVGCVLTALAIVR